MHCSLSASIEADAPRFLHFSDPALWAWAAVGVDRERGGQSAALLPASRNAPLRHGHADGRDDARCGAGQDAGNGGAHDVPAVSGSGYAVCRASPCADGFGRRAARGAEAERHCGRGLRYARVDSRAHPRRARTSSRQSHLKIKSKNGSSEEGRDNLCRRCAGGIGTHSCWRLRNTPHVAAQSISILPAKKSDVTSHPLFANGAGHSTLRTLLCVRCLPASEQASYRSPR